MILVFGKTGQVARELAKIAPEGTVFLSRQEADLTQPGQCAAIIRDLRPDSVINAAAFTNVDQAETDRERTTQINAVTPGEMAQTCAGINAYFLYISTDYLFDGHGSKPFQTADTPAPLNHYGASKADGEARVRKASAKHGILRTSWVFSAHGKNFVKTMLRLARERDEINVVADQIGGPTAAHAIAKTCLHMAQNHTPGTHHFSGAPAVSWADFAREIMRQAGLNCAVHDIETSAYPTPAQRPKNSRLDCHTLPQIGLEQPDWRADLRQVLNEINP